MIWSCNELQKYTTDNNSNANISTLNVYSIKTIEYWDTILLSSTLEPQLTIIRMAEAVARISEMLAGG